MKLPTAYSKVWRIIYFCPYLRAENAVSKKTVKSSLIIWLLFKIISKIDFQILITDNFILFYFNIVLINMKMEYNLSFYCNVFTQQP